jgi:hypothetical protein
MTLEKTLLQKLAEWRPDTSAAPLTVSGPDGWTVSLSAERNEEIAARVQEITLRRPEPVQDLRGWADRLCARATGLLEPLALLEIDAGQQTAQLRSQGPSERDGSVFYYEVLLAGKGEATVRRYQAKAGGGKKREQVGFALTHEALARFVGDLAAAV